MAAKYQVGDRVRLCKGDSIKFFSIAGMTTRGVIEAIESDHLVGKNKREYLIRFNDNRSGWYARNEIRRINQE